MWAPQTLRQPEAMTLGNHHGAASSPPKKWPIGRADEVPKVTEQVGVGSCDPSRPPVSLHAWRLVKPLSPLLQTRALGDSASVCARPLQVGRRDEGPERAGGGAPAEPAAATSSPARPEVAATGRVERRRARRKSRRLRGIPHGSPGLRLQSAEGKNK